MMARVINIHDAKVKTMSVGIKAMTVNDRQVTLAVFRQLMDVDLISEDGTLNGIPWGIINYHPDKCSDHAPHLHVVWQDGEELRRATVEDPPKFDTFQSDAADDHLTYRTMRYVFFGEEPPSVSSYYGVWQFHLVGNYQHISISAFESEEAKKAKDLYDRAYQPLTGSPFVANKDERTFFSNETIDALNDLYSKMIFVRAALNNSIKILQQEIAEEAKRRKKWGETLQGIKQLPQLFIAV
jgi:hypothetical protein